jgi:hypothetical protein
VARDGLEAVAGQVARREVVAQDRVDRVDELAARRQVALLAPAAPGRRATHRGPGPQPRLAGAPERQRHAQALGARHQERQVEAVQVVVLDHVGIVRGDPRHHPAQQGRLRAVIVARRLEQLHLTGGRTHRNQEDAIDRRIEPGGLEVQLEAAQVVEGEVAEVRASGRHQVLLVGR